ncbi:hypothetical protein B0H63DRAFT_155489 [Podospora didyma]|uniref:MutL C-terminal dimerisation domain-containing protein n=1 Tax=Podospora didyma TaxID=330526 RepID=A0AAE0NTA8_9PEZI|nr:hypothetical protein B0H63DRAFT_155489 [Podospora didyma]
MSIQPLPYDVVAQIKSSAAITSLNSAACGLLQNSLDADASKISISVDYTRGNCSVEDNGLGIPPADFEENGGLSKLHYTSRFPPQANRHGRHGQFLASLSALSLMSITSHHHEYRSHNSLTIHNSRVVARNIPALPEQRVLLFASGTRVTVRDIFGSMPVRVKQRGVETERMGSGKNFDELVLQSVALLLAWPGDVSLSIRDAAARRAISLSTSGIADQVNRLRSADRKILSRTPRLLAQSSLVDREDMDSWVSIGASVPGVTVRGCVSLQPVATKHIQFIALGIQPLPNEPHSNFLHEEVNKVFANSSFGTTEEVDLDDDGVTQKMPGFTAKELRPKRGIDRWPMFFLRITLEEEMESLDADELLDERHQSLAIITDLLQAMAYEFLKKHHFRPRSISAFERLKSSKSSLSRRSSEPNRTSDSGVPVSRSHERPKAPSRRSGTTRTSQSTESHGRRAFEARSASPFASWSRSKAGPSKSTKSKDVVSHMIRPSLEIDGREFPESEGAVPASPQPAFKITNPLFDKSGNLLRKPFDEVDLEPACGTSEKQGRPASAEAENTDGVIVWFDPATKIRSYIDSRTGFMVRPGPKDQPRSSHWNFNLRRRDTRSAPLPPAGENIVFEPTEPTIPRVQQVSGPSGLERNCAHDCHPVDSIQLDLANGRVSKTLPGRISKDNLRRAEVLGQVDRKFIFVKVLTDNKNDVRQHDEKRYMLVLIDQHAADERCRVENLMRQYFVPDEYEQGRLVAETESLEKPLRFDLSMHEGELLSRFRKHFEHWGIFYTTSCDGKERSTHYPRVVTVKVQTLPPCILERCRLEPKLLIDLLRKQIWKLRDNPGMASRGPTSSEAGQHDWVPRFHDSPEGILEMINSRSCRSESSSQYRPGMHARECD